MQEILSPQHQADIFSMALAEVGIFPKYVNVHGEDDLDVFTYPPPPPEEAEMYWRACQLVCIAARVDEYTCFYHYENAYRNHGCTATKHFTQDCGNHR